MYVYFVNVLQGEAWGKTRVMQDGLESESSSVSMQLFVVASKGSHYILVLNRW